MTSKILKIFTTIFLAVVLMVSGLTAGTVKADTPAQLSFDPSSGEIAINRERNIAFKINPNGRNVVAVDVTFEYIPDYVDITNVTPLNGFSKVEVPTGQSGMKKYSFTRLGSSVSTETVIATISLKGVAVQSSELVVMSNIKVVLDNATTLTVANGGVTQTRGEYAVVAQLAATPTPTPAPTFTREYRIAEAPADFTETGPNGWKPYVAEPIRIDNFEFKTNKPEPKFIWVEFKDTTGRIERRSAQIKLLGPDPSIGSCLLSFEGTSATLTLKAGKDGSEKVLGFGDKGIVKSGDTTFTPEQIKSWKNDKIEVVWPNAPTGQVLPVSLTNSDGQSNPDGQFCGSISALALGARVFCRLPSNHQTDNVDLILADNSEGGKKTKQKVSIDKEGLILGLPQRLENDKRYTLSLKAPRSIRRNKTFTAGDGITNLDNFIIPVGDIFPADGGDGKINNPDRSELVRQWSLTADATGRSGDFNRDGRVNSVDWTCMKNDFNQSDDPEPAAGVQPSASSSPSVSPSPSPSVSPSTSASPGT